MHSIKELNAILMPERAIESQSDKINRVNGVYIDKAFVNESAAGHSGVPIPNESEPSILLVTLISFHARARHIST
jgi:hypothetical protein